MGEIKDHFEANEGKRHAAMQAMFASGGPSNADLAQTGPMGPPTPQTPSEAFGDLFSLIAFGAMPEVYLGGYAGSWLLKNIIKEVAPKHPGLAEIGDLVGGLLGSIGGPEIPEFLKKSLIKESPEIAKQVSDILTSPAMREKLMGGVEQTQERAEKLAGQILQASGKKETAAKLDLYHRILRATGKPYIALLNSQLANTRITAVKVLSDAINMSVQTAFKSTAVAAEYGDLAGSRVFQAAVYSLRESISDALRYGFKSFITNEPEFQKALGLGTEGIFAQDLLDESYLETGARWIGSVLSVGRRMIMGADQFSKAIAWGAELHMNSYIEGLAEATRNQLVGGARIQLAENYARYLRSNPTDALLEKTAQGMAKITFTNPSKFSTAINQFIHAVPGLRLAIPYTRTPINLIAENIRLSPFGPVLAWAEGDFNNGNAIQAKTALAKWIVSMGMMSWLINKQAKGEISGHGPHGAGAKFWPFRKMPLSMKVGDEWYSYRHLPFATIIAAAVDGSEGYHFSKDPTVQGKIVQGISHSLYESADDLPFMELMTNTVHLLDSLGREDSNNKTVREFIGRELSSAIPAPLRIAGQVIDPREREAQGVLDTLRENVPYYADSVPLSRDSWGNEVYPPPATSGDEVLSAPKRLLNEQAVIPTYTQPKLDPVDLELFRLGVEFKKIPPFAMKIGGNPVPITPAQQDEWAVQAGHGLKINGMDQKAMIQGIMNMPIYQNLSDFSKKKQVQAIHDAFFHLAGSQLLKHPDVQQSVVQAVKSSMGPGTPAPAPITPSPTSTWEESINAAAQAGYEHPGGGGTTPPVTAPATNPPTDKTP